MARIPTPYVRPYEQRLGPGLEASPAPQARAVPVDDSIGSAMQGLGRAGVQMSEALALRDEAEENAWISRTTAEDQLTWTKKELELREGAGPGAPDHLKTVEFEWNKYRQERLAAAPSQRARQILAQRYDQIGLRLQQDAVVWSGGERNRKMVGDYGSAVESHAAAVRANPSLLDSSLGMAEGDYRAAAETWMTPEQAQAGKDAWRDRLVDGAVEGYRDLAKAATDQGDGEAAKVHLQKAEDLVARTYGARPQTGGFEGRLIQRESSGRPRVVNSAGYAGLYQFGAPRLNALGLYSPGTNEDLRSWSSNQWTGTFSIPGHPGVKSLNQFLDSRDAQRAAFRLHVTRMNEEIRRSGLDKYEGQTVGGVPITRDGLYAMIHLGGLGGATRALESGGAQDATDSGGTSVLEYARMGAGVAGGAAPTGPDLGRASKWYEVLDATRDEALRNAAATRDKARKAEQDARLDDLYNGIADGRYGQADIVQASGAGWLNYDGRQKAEAALVERAQGGLEGALTRAEDAKRQKEVEAARDALYVGLRTGALGEKDIAEAQQKGLLEDYEAWNRAHLIIDDRKKETATAAETENKRRRAGLITGLRTGRLERDAIEEARAAGWLSDDAEVDRAFEAADRREEVERRRDEAAETAAEKETLRLEREAEKTRKIAANDLFIRLERGALTGKPALDAIEAAQRDRILVDVAEISQAKDYVEEAAKATDEERREALLSGLESGRLSGQAALEAIDTAHAGGLLTVGQVREAKRIVEEGVTRDREEREAKVKAQTNTLHLALIDNQAGRSEIDAARRAGLLTDANVVEKLYGIVDAKEEMARKAAEAAAKKTKEERQAAIDVLNNDLQNGLQDGIFGRADIDDARRRGQLSDADKIAKFSGIVTAREDLARRVAEAATKKTEEARQAAIDRAVNTLHVGLIKGQFGESAIKKGEDEGWLTKGDDIAKFMGIVRARKDLERRTAEAVEKKTQEARAAAVDALHVGLRDRTLGQADFDEARRNGLLTKDADIAKGMEIIGGHARDAAAEEKRLQDAAETEARAKRDRLNLDLYEGRVGRDAIRRAREEGWLSDFEDIKAADTAADGPGGVRRLVADGLAKLSDAGAIWDPTDPDDKKALDALWTADGGPTSMRARDDAYVTQKLGPIFQRTGMIPKGARGHLVGMMQSDDSANALWSLRTMDQLERLNAPAFRREMHDATVAKLEHYRWGLAYSSPEKLLEEIRRVEDPAQAAARQKLEEDGRKLAAKVEESSILGHFDQSILPLSGVPDAPADALVATTMRQEFDRLFADSYVRTRDAAAARDMALKRLGAVWGVTRAGGGGAIRPPSAAYAGVPDGGFFEWEAAAPRLMRNPPEMHYGTVEGSHDWMREDLARELRFRIEPGEQALVISDKVTEQEIERQRAGTVPAGEKPPAPSYALVLRRPDGTLRTLNGENGRPRRVFWDIDDHMRRKRADERQREFFRPIRRELYDAGIWASPPSQR